MSIYCSFAIFDEDGGDYPAPIVYRESHILPDAGDPRGGSLDLAYIPGFITRDGRDDTGPPDDEGVWPYLRVSLRPSGRPGGEDTVVLDRDQVAALRDELSDWLLRCDDLDEWLETRT